MEYPLTQPQKNANVMAYEIISHSHVFTTLTTAIANHGTMCGRLALQQQQQLYYNSFSSS